MSTRSHHFALPPYLRIQPCVKLSLTINLILLQDIFLLTIMHQSLDSSKNNTQPHDTITKATLNAPHETAPNASEADQWDRERPTGFQMRTPYTLPWKWPQIISSYCYSISKRNARIATLPMMPLSGISTSETFLKTRARYMERLIRQVLKNLWDLLESDDLGISVCKPNRSFLSAFCNQFSGRLVMFRLLDSFTYPSIRLVMFTEKVLRVFLHSISPWERRNITLSDWTTSYCILNLICTIGGIFSIIGNKHGIIWDSSTDRGGCKIGGVYQIWKCSLWCSASNFEHALATNKNIDHLLRLAASGESYKN